MACECPGQGWRAQEAKASVKPMEPSCLSARHLPPDPCSLNRDSAWAWACQLLVRAGPGLGILWGGSRWGT